jgi:predicted SAM-dependent methyltransferase
MTGMRAADALAFDPLRFARKLNLGCGFDRREGFLNVDLHAFHQPDLVCDVLELAPLPSGHYEHVLAQDVLEHLPRLKTRAALMEWNRVLAVGGTLELRVPDVNGLARLLELPENQSPARQEELLQNLFGTQAYPGDFHYIGFTEPFLRALLEECGFAIEHLAREEGWLFHVVALKLRDVRRNPLLAIADDAEFVRAAYRDLLGREADPGGFDYHLRLLAEGASRESILERFTSSEEYRARHGVRT